MSASASSSSTNARRARRATGRVPYACPRNTGAGARSGVRKPVAAHRLLVMNEPILFSTGRCALGIALVAKSERGLCALLLGDDPEALALDLRQRFPQADVREAP